VPVGLSRRSHPRHGPSTNSEDNSGEGRSTPGRTHCIVECESSPSLVPPSSASVSGVGLGTGLVLMGITSWAHEDNSDEPATLTVMPNSFNRS